MVNIIEESVVSNFVTAVTNKINNLITSHNTNANAHSTKGHISYGQVDNTSTSTIFTATVSGITALTDGTSVMLRNGVVTSAAGFTLNVNDLGAKPVYNSMADATADTTIFNINYTMLFVYDSTRIANGCWICYRGYNANDNTIGYQIRTNSTVFTTTDKGYRYRIWLETDDGKYMPVNTSTSTNATANRSSYMNTREFWLSGKIIYNSTKADYQENVTLPAGTMWQQYNFALGYSFNNTGSALTLTSEQPLYMVCTDEGGGKGKLASPYYTQTLPSTEDNKLYIYLGHMTSATNMELALEHPIYEYKNDSIRLYRDTYTTSEVDTLLNGKSDTGHTHSGYANSTHTHTKSQITDFPNLSTVATSGSYNDLVDKPTIPTVPTNISAFTNDSGYLTNHQTLKTINNESLIGTGNITIENEEIEYLNGNFSGTSSYFITASSTKLLLNNGDRFYIHISNTSTSTSNAQLTLSYGSGSYYASGDIYDKSYNRIPSNQININTILLIECVNNNGYSWNIIEAFNGDINNSHTHSQYLTSSDISGKVDTAGTGLSKNGTTLNHSNSIDANSTPSLAKYSYDAQGHITGKSNVQVSDILTSGTNIKKLSCNNNEYDLLNNASTPLNFKTINGNNIVGIGDISISGGSGNVALACASDMGLDDTDPTNVELFLDVCTGKLIDTITKSTSGLTDTYTITYTDSTTYQFTVTNGQDGSNATVTVDNALSSSSENPVQNKVINTALSNKLDKASTDTGFVKSNGTIVGFGTTASTVAQGNHTHSAYVNPTIADNLTTNDSTQVLSAKQGKALADLIGSAITYINQ